MAWCPGARDVAFRLHEPGWPGPPMIPRFDRLCYGVARVQPPPPPPPTRAQGMIEGGDVPWGLLQAEGGWLRGPRKGHKRCYDDKHTQARACGRGWWTPTETQAAHSPSPQRPPHMHTYTGRPTARLPSSLALSKPSLAVAEPTRAKASIAALTTFLPEGQSGKKRANKAPKRVLVEDSGQVGGCVCPCVLLSRWMGAWLCLRRASMPP